MTFVGWRACARKLFTLALLAAATAALGQDAGLDRITAIEVGNGQVRITGTRRPSFTTFSLGNPPRLVIDFAEAVLSGVPSELPSGGGVAGIRTMSYGSDTAAIARVLIGFDHDVDTHLRAEGNTLVVTFGAQAPPTVATNVPVVPPARGQGTPPIAQRTGQAPDAGVGQPLPSAQSAQQAADEASRRAADQRAADQKAADQAAQRAEQARKDLEAKQRADADAAAKRAEQERVAQEKAAEDARQAEQTRRDQAAQARAEAERKAEQDRLAQEKAAAEARQKAEQARRDEEAKQRAQAEAAAQRAEQERLAQQKAAEEAARKADLAREQQAARERAQAEQRAQEQARREAAARAQAERKAEAEREAQARQKAKADREAQRRQQEQARIEAEREAQAQRKQKLQAERDAQAAASERAAEERRSQEQAAREASRKAAEERAQATPPHAPAEGGREASGAHRVVELVGFQPTRQGSRVYVKTNGKVEYTVSQPTAQEIVVELQNTGIGSRNNALPLDTEFFNTPVSRVVPQSGPGGTVRLRILLKHPAEFEVHPDGDQLSVEFQQGASR